MTQIKVRSSCLIDGPMAQQGMLLAWQRLSRVPALTHEYAESMSMYSLPSGSHTLRTQASDQISRRNRRKRLTSHPWQTRIQPEAGDSCREPTDTDQYQRLGEYTRGAANNGCQTCQHPGALRISATVASAQRSERSCRTKRRAPRKPP